MPRGCSTRRGCGSSSVAPSSARPGWRPSSPTRRRGPRTAPGGATKTAGPRRREGRAALGAAWVEAVFADAAARLEDVAGGADESRWARALERLVEEATALAGPDAIVTAGSGDGAAGVVARSSDGRIEVDATIAARLERARARLGEPGARILGLAGWDGRIRERPDLPPAR